MEEKKVVKESKFIDNIAYKNKFQFLLWVNENVILQRYFKINGFIDDSIYSKEFIDCMNEIVDNIKSDLNSKSRVFMWYTNKNGYTKANGFVKDYDNLTEDDIKLLTDVRINGSIQLSNGQDLNKNYIHYSGNTVNDYGENDRPDDGMFNLKFSFLIDDKVVFEKSWDANVYPRFVRNGVNLTNNMAQYKNYEPSTFSDYISYHMQLGKDNLINDSIRKICDTLSNTFGDKFEYTKSVLYKNSEVTKTDRYEEAVKYYGVIKPVVTGHTDIVPQQKRYNYNSALRTYEQSWKRASYKKTKDYFDTMYPTQGQIDYINRVY